MSVDNLGLIRQYDFTGGVNLTDDALHLEENELADGENIFWERGLRTIPGLSRVSATTFPGTTTSGVLTGLFQYQQVDGTKIFIGTSRAGKIARNNSGTWASILSTALSTAATTFWDWEVFNNTLLAASGANALKRWGGVGAAFQNVAGSPPQAKFVSAHGDYVLLGGYSSDPAQLSYGDTAVISTWPAGNVLNVGLDSGHIMTGIQRWGESSYILMDHSIWILSGDTPTTFDLQPTLSDVGHTGGPTGYCVTPYGMFFWSEGGPAVFNGARTVVLNHKLERLLSTVDWSAQKKISATYYPYRQQVIYNYQRSGQSTADRGLVLDLYHTGSLERAGKECVWWPLIPTAGGMAVQGMAEDSSGRQRPYFGTNNGFVVAWDAGGNTWNGSTNIVGRARTRQYHLGRPDQTLGMRTLDLTIKSTDGNLAVRYAKDGATSMTTHTTVSMRSSATTAYKYVKLGGDGAGSLVNGQLLQIEFVNATTGFGVYGLEVGVEVHPSKRRNAP